MICSTRSALLTALIFVVSPALAQPLALASISGRAQLDSYQARLIANPMQADLVPSLNPSDVSNITYSKLQEIGRLHASLKKGLRPEFAFIDPSNGVATLASGPDETGATCKNALLFDVKRTLKLYFEPQQTLWLRVATPANAVRIVDSIGSRADTQIDVFTHCAATSAFKSNLVQKTVPASYDDYAALAAWV